MFGLKKDKTRSKSRKKKVVTWLIVLAFLLGLVWYAVYLLNRPAIGVIKQAETKTEVKEQANPKELSNEYFSLTYPGKYELQPVDNRSDSLYSRTIITHQAFGLGQASKISITLSELEVGGVQEESAYKQAEAFPEYYSLTSEAYSGEDVTVLVRTNPSFEQTYLWPHGSYVLIISLTSAETTDELSSEIQAITESVIWH